MCTRHLGIFNDFKARAFRLLTKREKRGRFDLMTARFFPCGFCLLCFQRKNRLILRVSVGLRIVIGEGTTRAVTRGEASGAHAPGVKMKNVFYI